MKIFISWSGPKSGAVAKALREWLMQDTASIVAEDRKLAGGAHVKMIRESPLNFEFKILIGKGEFGVTIPKSASAEKVISLTQRALFHS